MYKRQEYITTPEEYSLQAYEGGSTLFGPYTLPAYTQELDRLARDMAAGQPTRNTLQPRDLRNSQLNFQSGVVMDLPARGQRFGSVLQDAAARYAVGHTVRVRFQTGHPKNNLHRNGTFLEVQRLVNGQWQPVADDGDWSTRYRWVRLFAAESAADISWAIPPGTPAGHYRIVHTGDAKPLFGRISAFTGTSRTFEVVAD